MWRTGNRWVAAVMLAGGVAFGAALARADDTANKAAVARGLALAETRCGACHAVGDTDESRLAAAPAFRDLHKKYAVEGLAEALAEGIVTAHPDMPQAEFAPDEIGDFLSYLSAFEK